MQNTINKTSFCNFDEFRVKFDNFCDFVPVVSSISMTIGVIQKHLYVSDMEANGSLKDNHYYTHLKEKDFERKWLLFVPGVNFIVAIVAFCSSDVSKLTTESSNSQITIINEEKDISSDNNELRIESLSKHLHTLNAEDRKSDRERKILEAPNKLEMLYPEININDLIKLNSYIDDVDYKEILYDTLIEESPCFYLSTTQIKRVLEAFNLCKINNYGSDVKYALIAIFQIIQALTPKSCNKVFKIISNLPDAYQILNLFNAASFFMHIGDTDPAIPLFILDEISKLPDEIVPSANILIFSAKNWNNLTSLTNFMISLSEVSKKDIPLSIMDSGVFYDDPRQEIVIKVLDQINKALEQFGSDEGADLVTAIIQIICRLTPENSEMLLKLISSLKPECQSKSLINADFFIERHPKDDINNILLILQKIYDSSNGYNFLFDNNNWNSLAAIHNLVTRFPNQREEIVNKLIEFDSKKIQNYYCISFQPDDSSKIEEIDIAKIIIWSDIFMKNAPSSHDSQKISPFKQYSKKAIEKDLELKELELQNVIEKLVNIPQAQYGVFNDIFLETIQKSESSVKERLEILDKALLEDMIMQKSILLFSANNHIFSYTESNFENVAFIQVMQTTLLPIFLEVMNKK